jgi:bisphosphoglycerate-dependent phosphoglycerate mutase
MDAYDYINYISRHNAIAPAVKRGERILVSAHGNR